jgi:hypothetical protein
MGKHLITLSLMLICTVSVEAGISTIESIPSMPESRCTVPKTAKTDREFDCLK